MLTRFSSSRPPPHKYFRDSHNRPPATLQEIREQSHRDLRVQAGTVKHSDRELVHNDPVSPWQGEPYKRGFLTAMQGSVTCY